LTLLGLATRKRREHGANLLLAAAMASPDGVTPPNMATERTGAHRGPWTLSNVARPGNAAGVTAGLPGSAEERTGRWTRRAPIGVAAANGESGRAGEPQRLTLDFGGNGDHIDAGLRQTGRVSASGRRELRPMRRQLAGALSQNPMNFLGLGKITSGQRHAQASNVTEDRRHILLGGPIGVGRGALPRPRCCRPFG
jgi:hypothetical protein